jgi:hypothetical protein
MIYTPQEYSQTFTLGKKKVSVKTVIRRCKEGLLPCKHKARKIYRKWFIEVN